MKHALKRLLGRLGYRIEGTRYIPWLASAPMVTNSLQRSSFAPLRVFLVCSGLGRVNRGYETFARECFDALVDIPELNIILFKGGGLSSKNEKAIWNLPRDGKAAKFLGRITGRGNYFIEQCTFMLALIPSDCGLKLFFLAMAPGNLLYRWRRLSKQRYSILLCNGGPEGPPFPKCDHIQEVTQPHYQVALGAGESANKISMVPLGINVKTSLMPASSYEKVKLREQISLPVDGPIIVCVGAINKLHNRMDYLISEVANLPQPRPFLLILGQREQETPEVLEMANQKLGPENFTLKTVPYSEIRVE